MQRNINNVHGFTLIELLAVIVVLAIVMLLAATAVLPTLSNAQKQTFAIEANTVIEAANAYFINGSLTGNNGLPVNETTVKCVTIDTLVSEGHLDLDTTDYDGQVLIKKYGNNYLYVVYLFNSSYMVNGAGLNENNNANVDIDADDVKDLDETVRSNYSTCANTTFPTAATASSGS